MHLKVKNLSVRFDTIRAVSGVTLSARPGEVLAIFGANGSGKTTFLKAVAGLVPPASGRIVYHGEDVTCLPVHERVARGICYVSDRARVALRMTVRENLDVGGHLRKAADLPAARKRVFDLFPVLEDKERQPAGILSGGERQMLVIGRALMGSPSLLLFDEPLLGLSLEARERILSVIDWAIRRQATILLAEHDLEAAFRVLHRYCIFLNGELIHEAPKSEVGDEQRLRAVFRRFYRAERPAEEPAQGSIRSDRGDR